ncbi:Rrf2 family transcriptional regulator [Microvirga sp. STR05]|uniref:Rrf2 family transcriptional regulator n=1 Tax=Hymenobacter duratus TaxID=2771356 RepID=A0ABR8JJW7_9BACT|nr:Rrf2 family transcriptional regulator [Hymenobacter duratus]MBD2717135.1 Rrf2 family transcriptional regulator [Hymenobacter duratus]MBR7952051.1 Rrf2 family transcriptional regulator [Microvirga sp. STR05]
MNTRFAVATHILAYLAHAEGQPVSSEVLASSAGTHPVVVRRLMGTLRSAGLVRTQLGAGGGALLARPAAGISLLDVFRAMREQKPDLFAVGSTNPNSHCDLGRVMQHTLEDLLGSAEKAMHQALAAVSLEQVMQDLAARLPTDCGCSGTAAA